MRIESPYLKRGMKSNNLSFHARIGNKWCIYPSYDYNCRKFKSKNEVYRWIPENLEYQSHNTFKTKINNSCRKEDCEETVILPRP